MNFMFPLAVSIMSVWVLVKIGWLIYAFTSTGCPYQPSVWRPYRCGLCGNPQHEHLVLLRQEKRS